MKIKIGKNGNLVLDDRPRWCPFLESKPCGTWCALFTVNKWKVGATEGVDVTLCHREYSISVEDFEDKRADE